MTFALVAVVKNIRNAMVQPNKGAEHMLLVEKAIQELKSVETTLIDLRESL